MRASDGSAQAAVPVHRPGSRHSGCVGGRGPCPAGRAGLAVCRPVGPAEPLIFQPDGPPPLHSRRYARDYNEVKELGSLTSLTRTDEQTEIARFWLASPTAIWNGVARQLIQAHGLELSAAARALGSMYFASADASMSAGKRSTRSTSGDRSRRSRTAVRTTTSGPRPIHLDTAVSDTAASGVPVGALHQQQRDGGGAEAAFR